MLHGLAIGAGFKKEQLFLKEPEYPPDLEQIKESMGFDNELPVAFLPEPDKIDENAAVDDISDDGSLGEFLQGIGIDDSDDEDDNNDAPDPDISMLLPTVLDKESMCDTFKRTTANVPWVPFKHPKDSATFTDLDKYEHELFDIMSADYNRQLKLSDIKGYKAFSKAWDLQVANLFRRKLDGEDVQTINRKSHAQLQQHHDNLKKHKELLRLAETTDPAFTRLNQKFRNTRRLMAPQQTAITCQPYRHDNTLGRANFGVPLPLNPEIAANAFQYGPGQHTIVVKPHQIVPTPMAIRKSSLGKEFRAKRYCWRCGFKKKEHSRLQVPFGDGCKNNCLHEQCSKCNLRRELVDVHPTGAVGPHCKNETHPTCSSRVSDWCGKSS